MISQKNLKHGVVRKLKLNCFLLPNPELGYFTEFEVYEGIILADGSLVIEIYYEILVNSFTYELEFNGGNTFYADRDAMVNDWIQ